MGWFERQHEMQPDGVYETRGYSVYVKGIELVPAEGVIGRTARAAADLSVR